jgi:hypothetical protein
LESICCRKCFFHRLPQISQGNNGLGALLLTHMVFSGDIQVFLQLSCIGQFGRKRAYLHEGPPNLQEMFLSKTNSFPWGNNVPQAAVSNTDGFP